MPLQVDGSVSTGAAEIRDFWAKRIMRSDYAMDVIDAGHAHAGTIVVMVRFSDGGGVFPLFQLS